MVDRCIAPKHNIERQVIFLSQSIDYSFAKSAPLILGVCLFDVVVAALLVSPEKRFDVHCTLAAEVSVLYLFVILSMPTGSGKSLPG